MNTFHKMSLKFLAASVLASLTGTAFADRIHDARVIQLLMQISIYAWKLPTKTMR